MRPLRSAPLNVTNLELGTLQGCNTYLTTCAGYEAAWPACAHGWAFLHCINPAEGSTCFLEHAYTLRPCDQLLGAAADSRRSTGMAGMCHQTHQTGFACLQLIKQPRNSPVKLFWHQQNSTVPDRGGQPGHQGLLGLLLALECKCSLCQLQWDRTA